LMGSRVAAHGKKVTANLDRAFFTAAEDAATAVESEATDIEDIVEAAIQAVETTTNDYVDGVDRDMIVLTLTPAAYGKLRSYIDTVSAPTADSGEENINLFHGVRVMSNHRQTSAVLAMCEGAVAQPVTIDEYKDEKINLSNAHAVELFYSYGTKAIMPDLIYKVATV